MPSGLLVVRGSRSPYSLQGSLPALLISIWHSFMAESAVSWDWGVTQAQRTASTETSLSGKVALHRLALDSHSRSGTTEQSKSPAGNPKGKLAGDFLLSQILQTGYRFNGNGLSRLKNGNCDVKIGRKDKNRKVRLGEQKVDHKSNDFMLEIVGFFCLRAGLIWF